jgi:WD40 repeat protein
MACLRFRDGFVAVIVLLLLPLCMVKAQQAPAANPVEKLAPNEPAEKLADKPADEANPSRMWQTADGKISVEAKLVEVAKGFVTLRKPDGRTVKLALAKLRDEDKEFIAKLPKPRPATLASAMVDFEREDENETYFGFLMFTPDSKTLIVWGGSGEVFFYDVEARKRTRKIKLDGDIGGGVALSPNGDQLVTTVQRQPGKYELAAWDLKTGKLERSFGQPQYFPSLVAFSKDGRTLIASDDENLRMLDWATGQARGGYSIRGPSEVGCMFELLGDGNTLLIGSGLQRIKRIHAWDVAAGRKLSTITPGHTKMYYYAVTPDGSLVATGDNHDEDSRDRFGPKILHPGEIFIWNARGVRVRVLRGHLAGVAGMAFAPDGKRLVVTTGDLRISEWDVGTGKLVGRQDVYTRMPGDFGGYAIPLRVGYSPDGETLVVACSTHLRLWREQTDEDGKRGDTKLPPLEE